MSQAHDGAPRTAPGTARLGLEVLELREVCTEPEEFVLEIEPSARGGGEDCAGDCRTSLVGTRFHTKNTKYTKITSGAFFGPFVSSCELLLVHAKPRRCEVNRAIDDSLHALFEGGRAKIDE